MTAPYSREDLLDLYVRVMSKTYPEKNVTREAADAALDDISEDGRVTLADAGETNLEPLTLVFIGASLSVVAGILKDGIMAAGKKGWDAWKKKPAEDVVKKLGVDDPEDKRMLVVIFVEMQQNQISHVEKIVQPQSDSKS